MKHRAGWGRLTAITALSAACVLAILVGCDRRPSRTAIAKPVVTKELTILTPHREEIRDTFAEGFWNWHLTNRGAPVRVKWVYRDTPQCVEYVRSILEMRISRTHYAIPDVVFGGGVADHATLAAEGLSQAIDCGPALDNLPDHLNGHVTRDAGGRWVATGFSSFGILFNKFACEQRGIEPPTTWADLADPRFFGWVALSDPRTSGSHRECLTMILQHEGWSAGWPTVMRILANARGLNSRSSEALEQVETGIALATFAVNFDGQARAAENPALEYVDPPGATAVSPDIVSVLSTAADAELAADFVRYVLSEEGQALWAVRREYTAPYGQTLYHYAISPDIYTKYAGKLAVSGNPLDAGFGLELDAEGALWQGRLLKSLVMAACNGANHVRLQQAWMSLIDRGLPADALARLTEPPFDEQRAAECATTFEQPDSAAAVELLAEWSATFAQRYAEAAGGDGT